MNFMGKYEDYCPAHARLREGSPASVPVYDKNNKNEDKNMAIVNPQTIADQLNLRGAKVVQRSIKMKGGFEGRVRVLRTEFSDTRHGAALFVKFVVIETNDEDQNPVGSERTWKQSLKTSKGSETAMNNILVWAACCAEMDPADSDAVEAASDELDTIVKDACRDPENAAGQNVIVGAELGLVTEGIITDGGNGRPYVVHHWSP